MSTDKRSELRLWSIVLVAAGVLVVVGAAVGLPLLEEGVASLQTGVSIKTAALWSFGITIAMLVLFALVAGDSLIGEIQFMLAAFFAFFVVITLLIAWIF